MQIPMFTLYAQILTNPNATALLDLPMVTLEAHSGAIFNRSMPILVLEATGHVDPIGKFDCSIPIITLSAKGLSTGSGLLDQVLPAVLLSATGFQDGLASFNRPLPGWKLSATAFSDVVASLNQPTPVWRIDAAGSWFKAAELSAVLPPMALRASAASTLKAVSCNLKDFMITEYPVYDFASVVNFNGKEVGFSKTGIYELSGENDNGKEIPWHLRTGKLDLTKNYLRSVWLTGKFGDNVILAVEDPDGNRYEYPGIVYQENESELRIKIGKGFRPRYFLLELSGEGAVAIDKIRVFGKAAEVKR